MSLQEATPVDDADVNDQAFWTYGLSRLLWIARREKLHIPEQDKRPSRRYGATGNAG